MSYVIPPSPAASVPVAGSADSFPVRRVYCVGRNYVEHAKEMGFTGREPPFFFMKPADAVLPIAEGEVGRMPYPTLTKDLHHEVELVWGYAVGLDMTRRDLQGEAKKLGRPWEIGKGFDHSAPIGPIHRAAECKVGADTRIALEVNGKMRQQSTIGKLIWNIAETIEHLSSAWELAPGDLIFSGTPEGVAAVVAGDVLKANVEGVGSLQVQIVAR